MPLNQETLFWGINEPQTIFITAILAALIAVWGILSQRAITARQVTLEFINRSESDPQLITARSRFVQLTTSEDGLEKWAWAVNRRTEDAKAISIVLNELELVAVAIQRGIMDDATFRRYYKSGVIRTWRYAEPYVKKRRESTGNMALYHEVEELALWYRDAARMPRRSWILRKFV